MNIGYLKGQGLDGEFFTIDGNGQIIQLSKRTVACPPETGKGADVIDQTLDANGANNLLVDNCFMFSSDDALAIGYRHNQTNVNVRNCLLGGVLVPVLKLQQVIVWNRVSQSLSASAHTTLKIAVVYHDIFSNILSKTL